MSSGAILFLRHCGNRQWDGNFVKATTTPASHTKSMNPSIMMNNFQRITFPSSVRFIQCDDASVANSHASFEWHSSGKKRTGKNEKLKAKWNVKSQMKICYRFACAVLTFTRLTKRTRWCCGFSIASVCHSITIFSISSPSRSVALPVSISMPILYRCCILTIFQMIYPNTVSTDNRKSVCCEHHQSNHARLRLEASLRSIVLWIHVVDCLHCLCPAPNDSQITNLCHRTYIRIHFGLSVSLSFALHKSFSTYLNTVLEFL